MLYVHALDAYICMHVLDAYICMHVLCVCVCVYINFFSSCRRVVLRHHDFFTYVSLSLSHRSFLPPPGRTTSVMPFSLAVPLSPTTPTSSQTSLADKPDMVLPVTDYSQGFETILVKRKVIVPPTRPAADPEITKLEVCVCSKLSVGSCIIICNLDYLYRRNHSLNSEQLWIKGVIARSHSPIKCLHVLLL